MLLGVCFAELNLHFAIVWKSIKSFYPQFWIYFITDFPITMQLFHQVNECEEWKRMYVPILRTVRGITEDTYILTGTLIEIWDES